jgi:NADPH:quinone reductase-like Zn-dependent oxidoreductase
MAEVVEPLPWIPGWDVAGTVEAVGTGVTRFEPGEPVVGMPWFPRPAGAYAELVTAPSRQLARAPTAVPLAEAAGLPLAGLTAWHALVDLAAVGRAQRVLVTAGAGGVGHLAVQLAASRGAHVLATARAENHDFLRALGAEPIDYTEKPPADAAGEVDVILHLAGADPLGLLECLRPGGLLIRVTGAHDADARQAAADRGLRAPRMLVEPDGASLERLVALVDAGELRLEVSDALPLAEAAEAHRRTESGTTRGKRVLRLDA